MFLQIELSYSIELKVWLKRFKLQLLKSIMPNERLKDSAVDTGANFSASISPWKTQRYNEIHCILRKPHTSDLLYLKHVLQMHWISFELTRAGTWHEIVTPYYFFYQHFCNFLSSVHINGFANSNIFRPDSHFYKSSYLNMCSNQSLENEISTHFFWSFLLICFLI